MAAQIFISHSSKDLALSRTICAAVERRGYRCWIAERDVEGGENYQESIVRAIRAAKVMILVFTQSANTSNEIKKEIALASRYNLTLIPVRQEDVAPSEAFELELATRQWIDLFGGDSDEAMNRLTDKIGKTLGIAPTPLESAAEQAPVAPVPETAARVEVPPPPESATRPEPARPVSASPSIGRSHGDGWAAWLEPKRVGTMLAAQSVALLVFQGLLMFQYGGIAAASALSLAIIAAAAGVGVAMARGLQTVRWPGVAVCALNSLSAAYTIFLVPIYSYLNYFDPSSAFDLSIAASYVLSLSGLVVYPAAAWSLSRWR